MATELVKTFEKQARDRIAELKPHVDEYNDLNEHLEAWKKPNGSAPVVPAGEAKPPVRRGRKGNRAKQFIEVVGKNPGITVTEAAAEMNIQPNYLYRLAKDKVEAGEVIKEGNGYKVSA